MYYKGAVYTKSKKIWPGRSTEWPGRCLTREQLLKVVIGFSQLSPGVLLPWKLSISRIYPCKEPWPPHVVTRVGCFEAFRTSFKSTRCNWPIYDIAIYMLVACFFHSKTWARNVPKTQLPTHSTASFPHAKKRFPLALFIHLVLFFLLLLFLSFPSKLFSAIQS